MDVRDGIGEQQLADLSIRWMAELDLVVGRTVKTNEFAGRCVRNSPGCSALEQPGTSFWVGLALLEDRAGRLDHLELGLELLDAPASFGQRIGLEALDPRTLPVSINA